jgi:hypothetical protein
MKRILFLLAVPLVFSACERSELQDAAEWEAAQLRATYQEKANSFYGLTEEQIIDALGKPVRVDYGQTSMDGNYKTLIWDDEKTWFNFWEADGGTAKIGEFEGVAIRKPASSSQ